MKTYNVKLSYEDRKDGSAGRTIEVHAAPHPFPEFRIEPGNLMRIGRTIDAAYQQPSSMAGRQQLNGIGNAGGPSSESDDAVRIPVELDFTGRNAADEPGKAARQRQRRQGAEQESGSAKPPQQAPRRATLSRPRRHSAVIAIGISGHPRFSACGS